MKKNIIGLSLSVLALSCMAFVSCDNDTKTEYVLADVPTLTVNSLSVDGNGGQYSVSFSVSHPADDATISASIDASWASVTEVGGSAVSLTIAKNEDLALRTANLTIEYRYTEDGMSKTVTEMGGIVQAGSPETALTVSGGMSVKYTGGSYSFDYTITSPKDDGQLKCSADVSWLYDFDLSVDGEVSFEVEENDVEDLRTGTITLTYSFSGGSVAKEVTIVQDHALIGDFPSMEDVIGTYLLSGFALDISKGAVASWLEWTLIIYARDETTVLIDGLTPNYAGYYPSTGETIALAYGEYFDDGKLTVPTQYTGYEIEEGMFMVYTPCTRYDFSGWYYSSTWPSSVFRYSASQGTWTANYGFLYGAVDSEDLSEAEFIGWADCSNPGIYITKVSSDTESVQSNSCVRHSLDESVLIKDYLWCED